ncbi:1-deoxy-D-xylulose-5-phosphate reductoisomerase [Sporanaerobium hydrogeniformans]|uniref:1-deoxy-D-xylulose-5-phosphate reductoisomerase n=1 Tax=Sporanaerobium hydrogeniformans TaxID=3072179 RepID=A0AC61DEZ2_9FIRM|nr:1-deoxy-D-xylulose-5-phosphate reductoisomerase [Sporanaerobium hydrogeniformans]PHV71776.1 1-deoxy-D-xylulose-5-phosphate reductoisomerase [Sporanaerobium hydrogeniformans]
MRTKKIAILGSTGSIGTQTLDVIKKDGDIQVLGLTTHVNIELLEEQIEVFSPQVVGVFNSDKAIELQRKLKQKGSKVEVITGIEGLITVATLSEAEMIVTAVVGMIGLLPTIEAIKAGKTIALANKETLVTAGELVMNLAKKYNTPILPVDSEHSAIFQCLRGNEATSISRLILTASGGPFRDYTKEQLREVTVEQALKHPNWVMGSKITIDSATLMNKGLEVIEAKYLFDVEASQIDVVVHKESIIHSMVEYKDGSTIAQLGVPDMRHPIAYALYYPERKEAEYIHRLDWTKLSALSFSPPKKDLFPCLDLAYEALKIGGTMPTVLNATNEIVVESFLKKHLPFNEIPTIIHNAMEKHICINSPSLDDILKSDEWAREWSRKKVEACWQKL